MLREPRDRGEQREGLGQRMWDALRCWMVWAGGRQQPIMRSLSAGVELACGELDRFRLFLSLVAKDCCIEVVLDFFVIYLFFCDFLGYLLV